MTTKEVLAKLAAVGTESGRRMYAIHGSKAKCFGAKVADLKVIMKQIKNEQQLALDLYDTGILDAMYLAGLVADGSKMTKKQLQSWAEKAPAAMISEYTVPWVASESRFGRELALEWVRSKKEHIASAGWGTLSGLVALTPDSELDLDELKSLLQQVRETINDAPNRVRYAMNGFVIALGSYVSALTNAAIETGKQIGVVYVDMGDTACKVPYAPEYIKKVKDKGKIGVKRKTLKC